MFKLYIILLISFNCCLVFGHFNGNTDEDDDDHKLLHELANNIMNNLQKDHVPTDNNGGQAGGTAANAPLHHLHNLGKNAMNRDLIDKTDKLKVSVGVKGIKFVSVERNGKVVNITASFGVGAAAVYTIDREGDDDREGYYHYKTREVDNESAIDASLEQLSDEYLSCIPDNARKNETKIVLSQKAKFGMKLDRKGGRNVKVTVDHGYIMGAVVNVTSNRVHN